MSNLVPIVTPASNAEGVAVGFEPTAIFEQSLDEGSISASSCFLVEIPTHNEESLDAFLANAALGNIVPAKVESERINLLDEDLYTGLDFGTDIDSGEKYRTKITINPDTLLKPNTTFAAMLSKDISLLSVFDPEPNGGNTGTGALVSQGVYEGLAADTYTITVVTSGNKNTAKYVWTRASDGKTSVSIEARARYIGIDEGLKIKFTDGTYVIGDSFVIRTLPADTQVDIYSWTFSSGSGDYQVPDDEKSDDVLNIPVVGGSTTAGDALFVVGVEPANADSMLKIPRKANVKVGDVAIITKEYTSLFNDYTVEFLAGATAGAEVIGLVGTDITVTIEDGVSTAQQVVDAFNASALVNVNFEASTESTATGQVVQAQSSLSKGIDATVITVTFNKDLKAASVTDKVKITSQPIYPSGPSEELTFTTAVSGKQLIMTLVEQG